MRKTSKNSTSFLLEQSNRWSLITTRSTSKSLEQFELVVPFLEELVEFVDELKFKKSRIQHQTGAVWSTKAVIALTCFYFSIGIIEVKTSRFLQDTLENIFSQTDAAALKPSAL